MRKLRSFYMHSLWLSTLQKGHNYLLTCDTVVQSVFVAQTLNICAACTVYNLMCTAHYVADVLMFEIWTTNTCTAVSHMSTYMLHACLQLDASCSTNGTGHALQNTLYPAMWLLFLGQYQALVYKIFICLLCYNIWEKMDM